MKTTLYFFILLFTINFCQNAVLFAQLENMGVCGHIGDDETMLGKTTPGHLISSINPNPTGKDFKAAVLYFKAADDNFDASGPGYSDEWECRVGEWPTNSASPNWMGELLISTPYNSSTVASDTAAYPYSITTYFYRMSNGNLWIYGDEVAYTGSSINKATNATQWRTNNGTIHQWYIDNYDLSSLDNDSDGDVDMIVFVNRARYSGVGCAFQGVAFDYLPAGTISDSSDPTEPVIIGSRNLTTNSGVYQRDVYDLGWRYIIFHEIGHQLHNYTSHYNGLHRWNLLSGSTPSPPTSLSGLVQSAWEKADLNWLTFTEITNNRIDYELKNVTYSNEAVKIPVNSNDYFILELRQNNAPLEITPDEGCGATTGLGEGLLVSYSRNGAHPSIRPADGSVAYVNPPTNTIKDGDSSDLFPNGSVTAITPYTTPNTNDHNGNNTHIAITNIHYDGDDIVFNVYQNYWSGNITSNTTWSSANSPYYIGGDITVASGVTLTIQSGVTVNFLDDDDQSDGLDTDRVELIVEGTLLADGVTFTSPSTSANDWYGIVLDGASSSSTIENSSVQWALRGIIIDDCSPTIEGNELDNNQYGIWVHGSTSQPTITENDIDNGSLPLVVSSSAQPYIIDNKSRGLEKCLYVASGGYPQFWNNTLYGYTNGNYQVFITGSSSGIFTASSSGDGNFFTEDVTKDIVQIDGGSYFYFYFDVFEDVGSTSYEYIDNNDATWCYAQYCYWDNGGVPNSAYFDGNVNYDYDLPNEPSAGVTWKRVAQVPSPFVSGFDAFDNNDYENAAIYLKEAFENNKDHNDANKALYYMCRAAMRIIDKTSYLAFLKEITERQYDEESKQIGRSFLMKDAWNNGELAQAESYALQAPKGKLYDRELLLDMVYYYAMNEDKEGERRIVSILKKTYSDDESLDEAIENATLLVEDERKLLAKKHTQEELPGSTIDEEPESIALLAYPNPFNPSTNIQFALPESQDVHIQIYDVLGRRVTLLVDKKMEQGVQQVIWDGRNSAGVDVAAGIYFANLKTGNKVQTIKLLLVR